MQGLSENGCDLLVIGGGINGTGIARDAAGRGLKVILAEAGDLAGATSSASSKLIHGGLRYLEHFDFKLVRESLAEREVMLKIAPDLVRPLTFVLPHNDRLRPAWMLRIGLFLYDHLGGKRSLPGSFPVRLPNSPYKGILRGAFARGFVYSDCAVDDAGLVLANARDARARGAEILTRARVVAAEPRDGRWLVTIAAADNGEMRQVTTRAVVNAAGPFAGRVDREILGIADAPQLRLVKGSHIVVPRIYKGDHAFILQAEDRRVVFVIPFAEQFSLVGTTEIDVADADHPEITAAETEYLCRTVDHYFREAPRPADVLWSFAGVRPLYDDARGSASAVTRDYVLKLTSRDGAPALSAYGGKLTTYRRLAEAAVEKLRPVFGNLPPSWTADAPLPPRRLPEPAGAEIIPGLSEAEAAYWVDQEWARTGDDILWRRTKRGLAFAPHERAELSARIDHWIKARQGAGDD